MTTSTDNGSTQRMSDEQKALALKANGVMDALTAASKTDSAKKSREARFSLDYAKGAKLDSLLGLAKEGGFAAHAIGDVTALSEGNFVSMVAPDAIITNKTAPGNHVLSLTGLTADEAIARLLSTSLNTSTAISDFNRVLATPSNVVSIVTKLMGRPDVPLKGRVQKLSEEAISAQVAKHLASKTLEVRSAYSYVVSRVMEMRGYLTPSTPINVVHRSEQLVASYDDVKCALLVQSLRGVFDDARIKRMLETLEDSVTPALLAEMMGRLFREFSLALPLVARDVQRFEVSAFTVTEFLRSPSTFPLELSGNEAVQTLSRYANFIVAATSSASFDPSAMSTSIAERKVACEHVLMAINASQMLETMSLTAFAALFHTVSAQGTDGGRRGLVLAQRAGQESSMTVVNAVKENGILKTSEVDPQCVRSSGLAPIVNASLASDVVFTGVINLLADNLRDLMDDINQPLAAPILWTYQVSDSDLIYYAMGKCSTLMIMAGDPSDPLKNVKFVYGVMVKTGWRMKVGASDGQEVFFGDPAAVCLYSADVIPVQGKSLPVRPQTIGTKIMKDVYFLESESRFLSETVQEAFRFKLNIRGESDPIQLSIPVLGRMLMDPSTGKANDTGDMYYASVREPGFDSEMRNMFAVFSHFLDSSDVVMKDKAASLLATALKSVMHNPVVLTVAQSALNLALVEAKIDMRTIQSQREHVLIRTIIGTALAFLQRFNKVTAAQLETIVAKMPVSSLTTEAQITLSTLPSFYKRG